MRSGRQALAFFILLGALLGFQFRAELSPGHYLYPAVVEDPAALRSFLPWDYQSARELRSGHFPLWNPYSGLGAPHLANLQSSVFFPLKWPFFLIPHLRVLDFMVILRLALLGAFTFLLARGLGRSPAGAALSGVAVALSGYFMKHMNMVNVSSEMWLPLIMLLLVKMRSGITLSRFTICSLAYALVMGGGNPEAAYYVCLMAFAFGMALGPGRSSWPGWVTAALIAPTVMGLALSTVQLAPFIEYLGAGWHIHDSHLHLIGSHPAALISSLVAPWLAGPEGSHPDQLLALPYLGAVVALLTFAALLPRAGRTRMNLFFLGAIAALLAVIYQAPPLGYITYLPPLDRFGNVKFAMAGVTLCSALLAGSGLDMLRSGKVRSRELTPGLAIISILIIGGAAYAVRHYQRLYEPGFTVPVAMILILGFLIVFETRARAGGESNEKTRGRNFRKLLSLAALGLCIFELMFNFTGFRIDSALDPVKFRFKNPEPPAELKPMQADPEFSRFIGMRKLSRIRVPHNFNLIYDLSDLRNFEGMYPRRYVEALGRIENFSMDQAVANFFSHGWSFDVTAGNLDHPLVDLMAVKYVLAIDPVSAPGFKSLADAPGVYQNLEAFPRAWELEESADPSAGYQELFRSGRARPVKIKRPVECDKIEIEARGASRLILAEVYFPGWRAEAAKAELKLEPWQDLFRSVKLGPGDATVKMTYQPWGFRIGLFTTLAALFSFIFVLAIKIIVFYKNKAKVGGRDTLVAAVLK